MQLVYYIYTYIYSLYTGEVLLGDCTCVLVAISRSKSTVMVSKISLASSLSGSMPYSFLLKYVGQQIDALQPTMRDLVGVEAVFLEDAVVRSSLQLLDGGGFELLEGIL